MKGILTIVLSFCFSIIFGQNYLRYYLQVNEAKLLAVDSNYLQSALLYQKTFEEYDFEFARDCIHAVEVAAVLKQDSLTAYFLKCDLKRGVPISYFDREPELEEFRSSTYYSAINDSALRYRQEFESGINKDLRNEINAMFAEDQRIRERYYKWWNFPFKPIIGNKWEKLNQEQVIRIIEITKVYGFPGEKLIGIDFPEYHDKIDSTQFSAGMPIIIFIHHYSQPNPSYDSILLGQVFKGNLYNEHFATICDFEAAFGKGKYECFGYYGLRQKPKNYTSNQFIEKRNEIGALSDNDIQKLNRSKLLTRFWNRLK
ncbi:hypothetical protein KFE94_13905 [bacterium SCSIO 12643]|nr:hypothetical protein KFE94_13905 [bacterium SCSIO 12643]